MEIDRVVEEAEQRGRPVERAVPADEGPAGEDAPPPPADEGGADEVRGLGWGQAEEDLLHGVVDELRWRRHGGWGRKGVPQNATARGTTQTILRRMPPDKSTLMILSPTIKSQKKKILPLYRLPAPSKCAAGSTTSLLLHA